jgi:spermidine/putrescine transport system substrate-binding protein
LSRRGGVVPTSPFILSWIQDGLLLESRPDQMENFKHMDPRWVDVSFDPGRDYTVPWPWGMTGVVVSTKFYQGDPNTWAIVFDPPAALEGTINVIPEMNDVVNAAIMYVGGAPCTDDMAVLKKVRDVLVAAKPKWLSMNYANAEAYAKEDIAAGANWNGYTFRARLQNPAVKFAFPKEGFPIWMDNAAILKDAKNVENAKLFLNFIIGPENAAMLSAFARYSNGIKGSEQFMPADMQGAPELTLPEGNKGVFLTTCPPEVNEIMTRIWTDLQK